MECAVSGRAFSFSSVLLLLLLQPALAGAQAAAAPTGDSPQMSRLWIVVGGGATTLLTDCSDCGDPENYRHAGSVLAHAGVSLSPRTDVGVEVLWVPSTAVTGDQVRTTFLMASVQFRPWRTRGFFLKAGSGLAFVRNWVVSFEGEAGGDAPPFTSTAFALGLGAGWEWRTAGRFGVQIFGTQHVATLGDIQVTERTAENVVGNFWSAGAAIVIR